jgi:hypothetical protein
MAHEAYMSVSVRGDFEPDEFTARVCLSPSKMWRKGQGDVERGIPTMSGWSLTSRKITGDVIDLFDLADELLLPLGEKAAVLHDAARALGAEITVHMVIFISILETIPTPAIGLSAEAVTVVERLGASLDIDTYRNDTPENKK